MKVGVAMMTVRQIERLWNDRNHRRLAEELLRARAEGALGLESAVSTSLGAAALSVIRLDELEQSYHPLNRKLLNVILLAQEADGGWGDPLRTALCLRALLCARGDGNAVERGMQYLATMQKAEGVWPQEPIRRMPTDGFVSAFVMFQLAGAPRFRDVVRIDDAVAWFASNQRALEPDARRMWEHTALRYRMAPAMKRVDTADAGFWS